nr:methyltransferase [Menippe mercenaria nudivirus]
MSTRQGKRKYEPYRRYSTVDHKMFKASGVKPSLLANTGVVYKTTHATHFTHEQSIHSDEVSSTSGLSQSDMPKVPEFLKEDRGYSDDTVYNFDVTGSIIQMMIDMKNKLEEVAPMTVVNYLKEHDTVRQLVHTYSNVCLNRCSVKILNINSCFDKVITSVVKRNASCSYVDLCCAPGGFTFTLLKIFPTLRAHLTSMTSGKNAPYLKMADVVNVDNFSNIKTMMDGDLTKKTFRTAFVNAVGECVNFVLGDGGIDCTSVENYQEYYTRPLILSQLIVGLQVLQEGGFMICKFFDMFSKYNVSLLALMSFMFESVYIAKPFSSKAGNAERYVLFKNYKRDRDIIEYVEDLMEQQDKSDGMMLNSFLDLTLVPEFATFVCDVNKKLARMQLTELQKYMGMIRQPFNRRDVVNKTFRTYKYWKANTK